MLKSTFNGLQRSHGRSFSSRFLPNLRNPAKFSENSNLQQFKVIQGHRTWNQSKAHMQLPISYNSNFDRISYSYRDIDAFC